MSYTPTTGDFGADTFTDTITDPSGQTSTGTVTVNVVPPTPVGNPDTYSATENTPLTVTAANGVLANDTDAAGNPLTAVIDTSPAQGSLSRMPRSSPSPMVAGPRLPHPTRRRSTGETVRRPRPGRLPRRTGCMR